MSMLKNKKAALLYYSLIFALVIALSILYAWDLHRNSAKNTDFVGQVFLDSYQEIQGASDNLYYIKQSAKLSIYNAIYLLAQNGFHYKDPCSKYEEDYVMWKNVFLDFQTQKYEQFLCYPNEDDIKSNYAIFLNKVLNMYFEEYTPTLIPKNNYNLIFNQKENKLQIIGIATERILNPPNTAQYKQKILKTLSEKEKECLSKPNNTPIFIAGDFASCIECPEKAQCESYVNEEYCHMDPCNLGCKWQKKCTRINSIYSIDPSFNIEMSYNFINKFEEYTEKTKQIEKNIIACLAKGSYKSGDGDDFLECSKEERLKQEIEDIENYEIIPILPEKDAPLLSDPDIRLYSNKVYTLLFKIKDNSFENPYSDEKLVIKAGIRFADEFPPPGTEIRTDEYNKPLKKDGSWWLLFQNNASDVYGYKIYYKKIEKTLDGSEVPSSPPTDISKMDNSGSPIIAFTETTKTIIGKSIDEIYYMYDLTGLEGYYYFFIIAGDDANNEAKEIITKRVTIPSIEEAQKEDVIDLSGLFNIE